MSIVPIGDMVRRIRRELEDEPQEDYLIASATNSATTISVNQSAIWQQNDVLEFDDNAGEQVKVRQAGTNTLKVKRGHNDTTAVAHASGANVLRNPRYPYGLIVNAVDETVTELYPYAWTVRELTITPSTTETLYALPPDFRGPSDLITVTQKSGITPAITYVNYGRRGGGHPIGVVPGMNTGDYGTGLALSIPILDNATYPVNVRYRGLLTVSDIEDGLMSTCVVAGASGKLVAGKDAARVATLTENTPYGAGVKSASWYEMRFRDLSWRLRIQMDREAPPARMYVG